MLKNSLIVLMFSAALVACSKSNKLIERTDYLESKTLPKLNVPEDLDFVDLESSYPIPEAKGSIEGLSPKELEALKAVPELVIEDKASDQAEAPGR